jgi:hypothetical protein
VTDILSLKLQFAEKGQQAVQSHGGWVELSKGEKGVCFGHVEFIFVIVTKMNCVPNILHLKINPNIYLLKFPDYIFMTNLLIHCMLLKYWNYILTQNLCDKE